MPRLAIGLMLLVLVSPVRAQQQAEQGEQAEREAQLSGLIIDNTITRFGHDFHRYLSYQLQDSTALKADLVVRERPSARWGSLVWVEYGQTTVYRCFLQPNVAEIETIAEQAAQLVLEEIERNKLRSLLQDTFDMERDEL